jgi:hypothetical protein
MGLPGYLIVWIVWNGFGYSPHAKQRAGIQLAVPTARLLRKRAGNPPDAKQRADKKPVAPHCVG